MKSKTFKEAFCKNSGIKRKSFLFFKESVEHWFKRIMDIKADQFIKTVKDMLTPSKTKIP